MTRSRLLLGRRAGQRLHRAIAMSGSLSAGLHQLAGSAYGERVSAQDDLAEAERAVAETLLWHLRILAGWLPSPGAELVRALAARFELENIDARLAALDGDGREPAPFVLGGLAIAWPRLEQAHSIAELAEELAASAWGVAGASAADLATGMRVAWARRVQQAAPQAIEWVAGAGALLVARHLFASAAAGRAAEAPAHVAPQLTRRARRLEALPGIRREALAAGSLKELRAELTPRAAWALLGMNEPAELWRAELAWWDRVERDAEQMLRAPEERTVVVAAVALLGADAQRTVRALANSEQGAAEAMERDGAAA